MYRQLPSLQDDYTGWYAEVVKRAQLAEHSPVRGSMIIKPYGYALWENIRTGLDSRFKQEGIVNAYFPLLIPTSYLGKEAAHVEGFAKECAVVTHHRLKLNKNNEIVPDETAKLEETFVVRPTSETIIWESYKRWIQSHRDLPLRVNQWANVMRWELRPRLFLRTTEILWQEGHTAHANAQEAETEAKKMLHLYADFVEQELAIPLVRGIKPAHERFAGAEETYTIEALMQDGKALQAGTSHFLGQNFAKAFDVQYTTPTGKLEYVWGTSWGMTTRLIGALVMAHGDEKGLCLPPRIAPTQVVIIPLLKKEGSERLLQKAQSIHQTLAQANIRVTLDDRLYHSPGFKFAEHEIKGIPLRIVVGARELAQEAVEVTRRDTSNKEQVKLDKLVTYITHLIVEQQHAFYQKAAQRNSLSTHTLDDYASFQKQMKSTKGFVWAHWDGTLATAQKIKEETGATVRCMPLHKINEEGKCIYSGQPSPYRVLFAQAY